MSVRCPCCNGSGEIEPASPVPLTPMEFAVWDAVRKSKYGVDAAAIARQVYADRYDGGPLFAQNCIYLAIRRANRRLSAAGQQIVSTNRNRGSVYRIRHVGISDAITTISADPRSPREKPTTHARVAGPST
jgi:hypothetical protein